MPHEIEMIEQETDLFLYNIKISGWDPDCGGPFAHTGDTEL